MSTEKDANFEQFIDDFVREKTGFNTAKELLESKPDTKFIPIIIAIGCLCLLAVPVCPVLMLALPGSYLVAKVVHQNKLNKCVNMYSENFSGDIYIDDDDFISFLNNNLKYLEPYFNRWSRFSRNNRYVGTGVAGTVGAAALNHISEVADKMGNPIAVGSDFGKKGSLIIVIRIRDDVTKKESNERQYYVEAVKKNDYSIMLTEYSAIAKTAPILQGAVKYYLNKQVNDSAL